MFCFWRLFRAIGLLGHFVPGTIPDLPCNPRHSKSRERPHPPSPWDLRQSFWRWTGKWQAPCTKRNPGNAECKRRRKGNHMANMTKLCQPNWHAEPWPDASLNLSLRWLTTSPMKTWGNTGNSPRCPPCHGSCRLCNIRPPALAPEGARCRQRPSGPPAAQPWPGIIWWLSNPSGKIESQLGWLFPTNRYR